MQIREPSTGWTAWITPGGGAEADEGPEETLRRELFEETGLETFEIGPQIWFRDHTAPWEGKIYRQIEAMHLVFVARFEPTFENQPLGPEDRAFRAFRWWRLDEIERSDEVFVPRRLGEFLRLLTEAGIPAEPIDVGK